MASYVTQVSPGRYTSTQWGAALSPFQRQDRYRAARSHLGITSDQSPFLGLIAAANRDNDPDTLSQAEVEYGVELARRAREAGDQGFLSKTWTSTGGEFRTVLQKLKDKGSGGVKGLWEAGEATTRVGSFLSRVKQQDYTYKNFYENKGGKEKGWATPTAILVDRGGDHDDKVSEIARLKDEKSGMYTKSAYDTAVAGAKSKAVEDTTKIYTTKLGDQKKLLDAAVLDREKYKGQAGDYKTKWEGALGDVATARAEADLYREKSVDKQLSGLRGGRAIAGDQGVAGGGGLASGAAGRMRRSRSDNIVNIDKKVDASDSIIRSKGPIVDLIGKARTRGAARGGLGRAGLAGGVTANRSYYASRFR